MKKLIETEHISFSYEEETGLPLVLEDVNITIGEGEFVAVVRQVYLCQALQCRAAAPHRHRDGGRYGYQG